MRGPGLRLRVVDDYSALSQAAAESMREVIVAQPAAAIVAATGNTPMGAYQALAGLRTGQRFGVDRLRLFQLDEYLGIGRSDYRSLYGWMKRGLLDPLGVSEEQVVRLPGDAADPSAECRAYDRAVKAAGGFDLAVLGLGPNGHLGFNEPPSGPTSPTRVVHLTAASVESNAGYWGGREAVPRTAVTAGMTCLLAARRVLLLVSGDSKREILRRSLQGPETDDVPASFLRRNADVVVLADHEAAASLTGETISRAPCEREGGSWTPA